MSANKRDFTCSIHGSTVWQWDHILEIEKGKEFDPIK
jgi:hypothetical protein